MTTAKQVRDKWREKIWTHETILDVTKKIYDREMPQIGSKQQLARLKYGAEYNFITALVVKYGDSGLIGCRRNKFDVTISVFREAKPDAGEYVTPIDMLNTIEDLFYSELGDTWGGLVEGGALVSGPPTVNIINIGGKEVTRARARYQAEEYV